MMLTEETGMMDLKTTVSRPAIKETFQKSPKKATKESERRKDTTVVLEGEMGGEVPATEPFG